MSQCSRRGCTGLILALLLRPMRAHGGEPPSTPSPSPQARTTLRRYRADAVILLFGIAIFRRAAVGGGQVSVEETGEGPKMRRTLFFAAGSDPKRAHGLKRLGWIREVVLGSDAAPAQAEYFGVLTSSPEETLEQSKKSIAAQSGTTLYSAVSGRNTAGHSRSAVTHFEFSSDANWSDRALIDHAQSTFHASTAWRETSWPKAPNQAPPTFLLQMATLLKQRTKRASGRYVYNEQEYLLDLETPSQGAVRGKIRNQRTGNQTAFRVWLESAPDSVVPTRIEFQPRSFLRLTFEALPA